MFAPPPPPRRSKVVGWLCTWVRERTKPDGEGGGTSKEDQKRKEEGKIYGGLPPSYTLRLLLLRSRFRARRSKENGACAFKCRGEIRRFPLLYRVDRKHIFGEKPCGFHGNIWTIGGKLFRLSSSLFVPAIALLLLSTLTYERTMPIMYCGQAGYCSVQGNDDEILSQENWERNKCRRRRPSFLAKSVGRSIVGATFEAHLRTYIQQRERTVTA